jgi:hypothetical protein
MELNIIIDVLDLISKEIVMKSLKKYILECFILI